MKEKVNRHVYGVFLRILKKGTDNARISVMELPSGQFIDGKIPIEIIRKVKLRHIISVDLIDVRPVDDVNKIVFSKNYNIQPSVYRNDVDESLLE
jgi:hypothetical protein